MNADQLLVVAGEVSGDMHGADLLAAIQARRPGIHAFGMGGSRLREEGMELVANAAEISVVGLFEALRVLPRARRIFARLLDEVDARRPAVAILIDSPDFNLRLAAKLKKRGVAVVYYVSPQVWAWRSGRVKTISRWVDRMLVLFGFEQEWYAQRGVAAVHVGHPLVDQVPRSAQAWDQGAEPEVHRVALLPGSRPSEVSMLLPTLLRAAEQIGERFPVELQLIKAPDLPEAVFEPALSACELPVTVVEQHRSQMIANSHLALCASGTATLEVGLLGTPMVVIYKVKRWSHWLGRLVIEVPHISLVNLVLDGEIVPELVQDDAEPGRIAAVGGELLGDAAVRDLQRRRLADLRPALGASGGSDRAADEVLGLLEAVSSQ